MELLTQICYLTKDNFLHNCCVFFVVREPTLALVEWLTAVKGATFITMAGFAQVVARLSWARHASTLSAALRETPSVTTVSYVTNSQQYSAQSSRYARSEKPEWSVENWGFVMFCIQALPIDLSASSQTRNGTFGHRCGSEQSLLGVRGRDFFCQREEFRSLILAVGTSLGPNKEFSWITNTKSSTPMDRPNMVMCEACFFRNLLFAKRKSAHLEHA